MKDIENEKIINYIIENNATTRETAKHFGVSRQTISNRLAKVNNKVAKNIMDSHFKFKSKRILNLEVK